MLELDPGVMETVMSTEGTMVVGGDVACSVVVGAGVVVGTAWRNVDEQIHTAIRSVSYTHLTLPTIYSV